MFQAKVPVLCAGLKSTSMNKNGVMSWEKIKGEEG
jgi:hypothetical protein